MQPDKPANKGVDWPWEQGPHPMLRSNLIYHRMINNKRRKHGSSGREGARLQTGCGPVGCCWAGAPLGVRAVASRGPERARCGYAGAGRSPGVGPGGLKRARLLMPAGWEHAQEGEGEGKGKGTLILDLMASGMRPPNAARA